MIKSNTRISLLLIAITLVFGSCTNHGKKTSKGHIDVYYKDGINETEAGKTADFLYSIDVAVNNNTSVKKSMQLLKEKDTILFRMVVDQAKVGRVGDESFHMLGQLISDSVFAGQPVKVDLTDDHFKTVKALPYQKIDLGGFAPSDSTN
jgi:hypothetical protein